MNEQNRHTRPDNNRPKSQRFYKMWGEHISLVHLLIAILVNVGIVVISLLATIGQDFKVRLIVGLVAIVVALVVNSLFIRPKRNIEVK